MVMRAVDGIKVNDETLAFDMIKKAGPGGHFISSRHTRRHMRSELYKPLLSDRENRDRWKDDGGKDIRQRAAEKVREILTKPPQSIVPEDVRERIKQEIPGVQSFIFE